MNLKQLAIEFALSTKKGFTRDRSKSVGASEIGRCIRRTVYDKLGMKPDDSSEPTNGFAIRGDKMEDAWIAPFVGYWAQKNGGTLLYAGQSNQIELSGKNVPLSATPDGLVQGIRRDVLADLGVPDIGPSQELVVEMKSLDPRYGRHKLPKIEHVPQTMQQLGMIRRATNHRPDYGIVWYNDASDYSNVSVFPVKYSEASFKALVRRGDWIMKCSDPNLAPPEGKQRGGNECTECPFAKTCLGYRPYVPGEDAKAPTKAVVKEIDGLAEKVFRLKEKADAATQKVRDQEAKLWLKIAEKGHRFVQGKYTTHAKVTKSQLRTDVKKLAELAKELGATAEQIEACKSATKEGTSLSVERN